jgi:hypothetical protein
MEGDKKCAFCNEESIQHIFLVRRYQICVEFDSVNNRGQMQTCVYGAIYGLNENTYLQGENFVIGLADVCWAI